jgi:NADH-quinone oxidoreductase subunit A
MVAAERREGRARQIGAFSSSVALHGLHFPPHLIKYPAMNGTFTHCSSLLAQTFDSTKASWIPVVLLLLIGIGFAVINVVASIIIGPGRTGPGKEETYESGMVPIGDTRKRFNVRFYIVAMIFLVFDVEIVFMYPWATIFAKGASAPANSILGGSMLLWDMIVFVVILLVAYFYAWFKGVFRWD